MANRMWTEFSFTPVKGLHTVYAQIAFNGTGSPTLLAWNPATKTYAAAPTGGTQGVLSVTRNGTGDYTIKLQDTYQRLLGYDPMFIGSTNAAAPIAQVKVASSPNAAGSTTAQGLGTGFNSINLLTFSAQGTAADPAATELGIIGLTMQNSAAF